MEYRSTHLLNFGNCILIKFLYCSSMALTYSFCCKRKGNKRKLSLFMAKDLLTHTTHQSDILHKKSIPNIHMWKLGRKEAGGITIRNMKQFSYFPFKDF